MPNPMPQFGTFALILALCLSAYTFVVGSFAFSVFTTLVMPAMISSFVFAPRLFVPIMTIATFGVIRILEATSTLVGEAGSLFGISISK